MSFFMEARKNKTKTLEQWLEKPIDKPNVRRRFVSPRSFEAFSFEMKIVGEELRSDSCK